MEQQVENDSLLDTKKLKLNVHALNLLIIAKPAQQIVQTVHLFS